MNLRPRGAAGDAPTAALDVAAAGRFLAAAGFPDGAIRVVEGDSEDGLVPPGSAEGWARGTASLRVSGGAANEAALGTAQALGLAVSAGPAGSVDTPARQDGDRLAARFEVGLGPDETVELVLGTAALRELGKRLASFDATLTADATPRRLVLAGLPEHGPSLAPELVAAIVHPQVLVESAPSDPAFIDLLRLAADSVVEDVP